MSISNLVTTPHAVCYINSVSFARCHGLTYEVISAHKEVKGIDVLTPIELIPTGVILHGTVQVYRLHNDGGMEAAGLIPTWNKLTRGKYFSLMVIDRSTDNVLVQVGKCAVSSQSWSITPKSYVLGTVSFVGMEYSNDAE